MAAITPQEHERRQHAYNDNPSDMTAAAALGMDRSAFSRWRTLQGLPIKSMPTGARVTPQEDRNRRLAYQMTESDREAAWVLGIPVGTFNAWRERTGFANKWNGRRPEQRTSTPQEQRRRLDAWASSRTISEAAGKVGITPSAFESWTKRRGIPSPVKILAPTRLGFSEQDIRMWHAYCTAFSDHESANRLGINHTSVRRWRRRNNLPNHKRTKGYWERLRREALNGNPVADYYVRKRFPKTHGLPDVAPSAEANA